MRPARFPLPVLLFAAAWSFAAPPPAHATWSTSGNPVQDSARDETIGYNDGDSHGAMLCSDGASGLIVASIFRTDSMRINRLNGVTAAKMWNGGIGFDVNHGGNLSGHPLVAPGPSGGAWVAWTDTRASAPGLYIQLFDVDGNAQLAAGGQRISTFEQNADDGFDIFTTPSDRRLIVAYQDGGVRVQRFDSTGTAQFAAGGVLVSPSTDSPVEIAASPDNVDGTVVAWTAVRTVGGGPHIGVFGNRVSAAGNTLWSASGHVVYLDASSEANDPVMFYDNSTLSTIVAFARYVGGLNLQSAPITAQRMDAVGAQQWGATGVNVFNPVTTGFAHTDILTFPKIATDGAGGCFIGWVDGRDFTRLAPNGFQHAQDLFGQHLNSAGVAQWAANGAPLDSTPGTQTNVRMLPDGSGGVLIAYEDYFATANGDIVARRFDNAGTRLSETYLTPTIGTDGPQKRPTLASDGSDGFLCAWEDQRNNASNGIDVYATHRRSSGSVVAPKVTVTSPNGGETLIGGSTQNITWTSVDCPNSGMKLQYSLAAPGGTRVTVNPWTANDGTLSWAVPATTTTQAKVYVSDAATGVIADSSDAVFTICGGLTPPAVFPGLSKNTDVAIADFDEDGNPDFLFSCSTSASVVESDGAGGYLAPLVVVSAPENGVATGDFNRDGMLDVVAVGGTGVDVALGTGTGGVGDGGFAPATHYAIGKVGLDVAVADLDQDGILDLVMTFSGRDSIGVMLGRGTAGIGDGTFDPPIMTYAGSTPRRICVNDFDRDGVFDVAVTNPTANTVSILRGLALGGHGSGHFDAPVAYPAGTSPFAIAATDLDLDGIIDLVATSNTAPSIAMLKGQGSGGVGDGTFAAPVLNTTPTAATSLGLLDINHDGLADLVEATSNTASVSALLHGTAHTITTTTYTPIVTDVVASVPTCIATGDLDGDGSLDAVIGLLGTSFDEVTGACGAGTGTMTVATPNGGESFAALAAQTLTWTKPAGTSTVDLELTRDGGANWESIARSVPGSSFSWMVTPPATTQARVRVRDSLRPLIVDASDATFSITVSNVGVAGPPILRPSFSAAWPNPATGTVRFALELPAVADVHVDVFDIAGRHVRTLADGTRLAGRSTLGWDGIGEDGRPAPGGLYLVRARWAGFEQTRRVIRVR
ncbi:MAG: FG-GAP-like repeat-containing protein [Candidatus Eisenbacteria bacterium]